MKRIKAFVSMLMAAALLVLLPGGNTLTAKADGSVTYSVKYLGGTINEWRFQTGSTFDETKEHMGAVILPNYLKDGDAVVVYPGDNTTTQQLQLGAAKLGNLTIFQNTTAVVFTGGVKDCYVLAGSYCAINGDVTNAYIYDNATCTFNNNVLDMTLYVTDEPHSNMSCAGTVGHYQTYSTSSDKKLAEFFDIDKGVFSLQNGNYMFGAANYKPTPSEAYTKARAEADGVATAPSTPATPAAPSDEYDKVPKTGESNLWLWLLLASVTSFTGSCVLRRKASK